jgi:hypothetical protein
MDHARPADCADDGHYERLYPYYAELAALSELKKKPGFGAHVESGMGGHCLLYLHGVRLDRAAGYPVLVLCAPGEGQGVGLSVNSHYKNAHWVAAEGRDFIWRGALKPGEALTRESYERTQDHAKAMGMLDGVTFHERFFADKPTGMSDEDFMYEISVATDYAIRFGRDTFRTRVPLDRARMAAVVDYLNGLNAPYRAGAQIFEWRLFNNNCAHVAHNALAVAGIWAPWPVGEFFFTAMFCFPVPKNELVDLALRTNDFLISDADAVFNDDVARRALMMWGVLPTAPGALRIAEAAIAENDIYAVERLKLIFYDNPFWGPYRFWFKRVFGQARYGDLRANLEHFAAVYEAARQNFGQARLTGARAKFQARYEDYITAQATQVEQHLAALAPKREVAAL